jgi:hypothetical protein
LTGNFGFLHSTHITHPLISAHSEQFFYPKNLVKPSPEYALSSTIMK